MKFKLLAGAALAAVFAAGSASAQEGWYGAVDLGYHWPEQFLLKSTANPPNGPFKWDMDQQEKWTGFARLGYQFTPHWRAEIEAGYRPGDIEDFRGTSANTILGVCTPGVVRTATSSVCGSPDGDIESWTFMANVIFDVLPDSSITPFIG